MHEASARKWNKVEWKNLLGRQTMEMKWNEMKFRRLQNTTYQKKLNCFDTLACTHTRTHPCDNKVYASCHSIWINEIIVRLIHPKWISVAYSKWSCNWNAQLNQQMNPWKKNRRMEIFPQMELGLKCLLKMTRSLKTRSKNVTHLCVVVAVVVGWRRKVDEVQIISQSTIKMSNV